MKICVAQSSPIKGDIEGNIENHKKLIGLAVANAADLIIFPELSLTGYEPTLAQELALDPADSRLDVFQTLSNNNGVTIGLGAPIRSIIGTCINMLLFQPHQKRQMYSKQYLHPDEAPFFLPGESSVSLNISPVIALAICYEISVPDHSENAFQQGAKIYIASVAKFVNGIEKAIDTLSNISRKYAMMVCMSNCVGISDGYTCAGKSAVWNSQGLLIGQLNDTDEGLLIVDTDSAAVVSLQ